MNEYLVIAELETTGYIVGSYLKISDAEAMVDELFVISDIYPINEIQKLSEHFKGYQSYKISGNAEFFTRSEMCNSNGFLSVYIIDIKSSDITR